MPRHGHANARFLLVVSVLCAVIAPAIGAQADDDIQLIRLNSHSFFIPKPWMAGGGVSVERATNGGSTERRWKPQAEPIDGTDLTLINPGESSAIVRDWTDPLASLIHLSSYRETLVDFAQLGIEAKMWLEIAASQPADADGFVRVWAGFAKPSQEPFYEKFVYKGYLNKVGQPLIIVSYNTETPFADHFPSDVFIAVEHDLMLRYQFSNKKYPESTWWDLYQHTLAFLSYMQRPK
jgi:hypothetical protein